MDLLHRYRFLPGLTLVALLAPSAVAAPLPVCPQQAPANDCIDAVPVFSLQDICLLPVKGCQPLATRSIEACRQPNCAQLADAVDGYLDALLTHDGSRVPLAPEVRRTELGLVTAEGDTMLRNDLTCGHQYKIIHNIRDRRFYIVDDEVIVFYLLDTGSPPFASLHAATAHVAERFKLRKELLSGRYVITEIEAIFWPLPGVQPASNCWSQP